MIQRKIRPSDPEESDEGLINLTPLIDVVFVVLIVFILIAPMVEIDRIDLASASREKKETSIPIENARIVISVQKDNTVFLNKEKIPLQELHKELQKLRVKFPKESPRLIHDRKAEFGTYQSVKNAIESCGFTELDLMLAPDSKQ